MLEFRVRLTNFVQNVHVDGPHYPASDLVRLAVDPTHRVQRDGCPVFRLRQIRRLYLGGPAQPEPVSVFVFLEKPVCTKGALAM